MGILQTTAMITAADILNDRIVVATADQYLSLWSAYSLSAPTASVMVDHPISTLRFNRLLNQGSSRHNSALTTPQKVQPVSESSVNLVSSITSTPTQLVHEESDQRETRIQSSIQSKGNALLERVENHELRGVLVDILQPMITELQTYVHREISELKADMIRQFSDQEQVIQEQYEQIEQLLQMLQQKR